MIVSRRWMVTTIAALAIFAQSAAAMAREAPGSFADLAEKLLPAVVNISTTQTIKNPERVPEMPQFPPGSPFEDFFKEFLERQTRPDAAPKRATSLGSGFIIDAGGYVVTNNHVIADADEITVTLHDDTTHKATLVGRDSKTDLAVLKIDPGKKALVAVPWGNSDDSRIGDWVLAIGNPFGLGGTVTAGIVSARARDINAGPYDDFIQTDASINRGNSGGPLFNSTGEVVGINTAIFSPSGGSIGIGFAIPASLAKPVIDDLKQFGRTRRGWLGVRIQSLDPELAESMGLSESKGALVASINADGPAAKAKLKPGDVILKFDGRDITEMRKLPRIVAETAIGKKTPVEIWRDGKRMTLDVAVGELPEEPEEVAKAPEKPQTQAQGQVVPGTGMTVSPLNPALRERFGLEDDTVGLVVTDVKDGAAADKGIKPGDVVIEAGNKPVRNPADLIKAVEAAKASSQKFLLLRVENPQALRYVALPLAESKKK
ncbi:DegQ family serine endoprotease [Magnetospirillum sulfuroxidans]|uniref:Probable periplasmic serine endoprotease DegP-like n=1 Tax=Magnetospirillum sulfuroxidans TaxID=611300 RepID=A0ABS5I6S8_9PROT|nr:DegQ family serine endoprotease [Magnetospirillum sulfuroxidans]MBR9970119.1 DegQ family serine endoprotease [Magnetospirillum sulfuroxidans]